MAFVKNRGWWVVAILATMSAVGCGGPPPAPPAPKPLEIEVSHPVADMVADSDVFSGRVDAISAVDIKARVSGYLRKAPASSKIRGTSQEPRDDELPVKEGGDVKEGDLLFVVDPDPFKATLAQANATVKQNEAQLENSQKVLQRTEVLVRRNSDTQENLDQKRSDRDVAEATLGVAKANVWAAKINLEFSQIHAPFDGRISRRMVDPGNVVVADNTVLTSIVMLDPIHVDFDVDERTWLRIRRLILSHSIATEQESLLKVDVGLADEEGFSFKGEKVNFFDNKIDTLTGTMRVRAVIKNPDKLLQPGMFARVRLPIGEPQPQLLVAEKAIGTDQGRKFIYIVNDKNEAVQRTIEVGAPYKGLRVVRAAKNNEPLKETDKVVVRGLQRLRNGTQIEPKLMPMPRSTDPLTPAVLTKQKEGGAEKPKGH